MCAGQSVSIALRTSTGGLRALRSLIWGHQKMVLVDECTRTGTANSGGRLRAGQELPENGQGELGSRF